MEYSPPLNSSASDAFLVRNHKSALFALLRQQIPSPLARRTIPDRAGIAVAEVKAVDSTTLGTDVPIGPGAKRFGGPVIPSTTYCCTLFASVTLMRWVPELCSHSSPKPPESSWKRIGILNRSGGIRIACQRRARATDVGVDESPTQWSPTRIKELHSRDRRKTDRNLPEGRNCDK